jgi:RNA polymerase sigma-70 factor (ECF subfamily)
LKVINLHQEETEMIRLAIATQAAQAIYNQFSPKMLGVCRQYMKDMQLSEDVMITAFMKVLLIFLSFSFKVVLKVDSKDYGKRMYHQYGFTKNSY